MSEELPTPAPWRWLDAAENAAKFGESDMARLVGPLYDEKIEHEWDRIQLVCHFGNNEQYYPTEGCEPNDADKRLIAAAPDLLLELQNIANANPLTWDEGLQDQFQAWAQNRARHAIKKALL